MPRMSKKPVAPKDVLVIIRFVSLQLLMIMTIHSLIEIAYLGPESIEMFSQFKERFEESSLLVTDIKSSFIGFVASRKMMLV